MSTKNMDHYTSLASHYDEYYNYSTDYVDYFTNKIIEDLSIKNKEVVVELGAGTGIFAKAILHKIDSVNMKCVDNSALMLEMNKEKRIEKLCQDAVEFSKQDVVYDKIYMKEFIHHIPKKDRLSLFKGLYRQLKNRGRLVILMEPGRLNYPLFEEALKRFKVNQPSYLDVISKLEQVGFLTSYTTVKHEIKITKTKYIEMVKSRYMSVLESFTEAELENGIKEINESYKNEELKFQEVFYCIKGVKSKAVLDIMLTPYK